ncbi:hypothetical protein [Streptomyces sp. NPDC050263]|uniref:hypothetical protein n=1 Tax=Streptomyces sp. NPDC050263 TaxID=3155037 RepID=UPI003432A72C
MTGSPEAEFGAELVAALNAELGADSPHLFTTSRVRPAGGSVSLADGRSRVSVLSSGDTYLLTFLREDRRWAHGATQDMRLLAPAARAWLAGTGLEEMAARWPFVEFSELQLAYERGDALETQWRLVRQGGSDPYREVVELAAENPTVSRFFPALGHNFLVQPGPFDSRILASVAVQTPGRFRLWTPHAEEPLAEGDATSVIAALAELLNSLEG